MRRKKMKVPFLDLKAKYEAIKDEITVARQKVVLPVAENCTDELLSLSMIAEFKKEQIERVAYEIKECLYSYELSLRILRPCVALQTPQTPRELLKAFSHWTPNLNLVLTPDF